jgi:hypothetical protein
LIYYFAASNNELKDMNVDQTKKIDALLEYADDSKQRIADLHDKLYAMFDFTTKFARMMITFLEKQPEKYINGKSLPDPL